MNTNFLSVENFDYDILEHQIAQYPQSPRDQSKLLVHKHSNGLIQDVFANIATHLPQDAFLVFNNSKTIAARLYFYDDQRLIQIFCLAPLMPQTFEQLLEQSNSITINALIGNGKKWKNKLLYQQANINNKLINISVEKIGSNDKDKSFIVKISWNEDDVKFKTILSNIGHIPIPPYINRPLQESDKHQYQTIYGNKEGSVATPTAGLHFTNAVFEALENAQIKHGFITLHVGADTFKPMQNTNIYGHQMHGEFFFVSLETLEQMHQRHSNIFAVGTTSLRTLESIHWIGVQLHLKKQIIMSDIIYVPQRWQHPSDISFKESLLCLIQKMKDANVDELRCQTSIMIMPDDELKSIAGLITNFHQPKSTLLLIIESVIGKAWRPLYDYALCNDFKFFSFGDVCLLFNMHKQISNK